MPLRWGIAGCSDITSRRVAPAIRDHPLTELVTFYSTDEERGRRFAEEFGAQRAHTDLDAFVSDQAIDAVYVAGPVDRHLPETLAAAGAGKHVICEKPMALDADEGARMVAGCREAGVQFAVAYYRRFLPQMQRIKRWVEEAAIGQVVLVRVAMTAWIDLQPTDTKYWRTLKARSGGGPLMDLGSHYLDLLCYFLGRPIAVSAMTDTLARTWDVEDSASLLVRFSEPTGSGGSCHAVVTSNWNVRPDRQYDDIEIHGTDGSIVAGPLATGRLLLKTATREEQVVLTPPDNVHMPLVDDMTSQLLAGRPPTYPGEEGLLATQIMSGAFESSRTGQTVHIAPDG
ncbi:MAG: hypothetical protein CL878_14885 [Dehalococcoidia bacterium]|nr:hypothetical protein [Dehalococcoidia bacterium]